MCIFHFTKLEVKNPQWRHLCKVSRTSLYFGKSQVSELVDENYYEILSFVNTKLFNHTLEFFVGFVVCGGQKGYK